MTWDLVCDLCVLVDRGIDLLCWLQGRPLVAFERVVLDIPD